MEVYINNTNPIFDNGNLSGIFNMGVKMKNYIIQSELGRLCRVKGILTDKEGRKRRGLIYWSDFDNDLNKTMKFFYISAYLQYIFIRSFASDIKEVRIIKLNSRKE